MLKAFRFTVFIIFIGVQGLIGKEMSIRFEQITTQEGLSQSTVNDILYDSRDFFVEEELQNFQPSKSSS